MNVTIDTSVRVCEMPDGYTMRPREFAIFWKDDDCTYLVRGAVSQGEAVEAVARLCDGDADESFLAYVVTDDGKVPYHVSRRVSYDAHISRA